MDKAVTYIDLDVHKDTITVALAEAGGHKDVTHTCRDPS